MNHQQPKKYVQSMVLKIYAIDSNKEETHKMESVHVCFRA